MTKTKNKPAYLLLVLLLIGTTTLTRAQGGPGGPGPDPDPSVPFDGGLSLVVAAGIAYAAKKGYDKRIKMTKDETAEK